MIRVDVMSCQWAMWHFGRHFCDTIGSHFKHCEANVQTLASDMMKLLWFWNPSCFWLTNTSLKTQCWYIFRELIIFSSSDKLSKLYFCGYPHYISFYLSIYENTLSCPKIGKDDITFFLITIIFSNNCYLHITNI